MAERFDAIVIGAGQAGLPLCERLGREGFNTALIERSRVGGTCVNYGCWPTKTLVASARVAALARRAAEFGVDVGANVRVDMRAVKARKDAIVNGATERLAQWIPGMARVTSVRGHARFVGPRVVEVDGRRLEADMVFINVGARPLVPAWPGVDVVPWFTSTTILDVDFLPAHLVVVGGSYVGLEFAQMYRRFGSSVCVVERAERLLPREDRDIAEEVRAILEREGIEVRRSAECISLARSGDGVAVGLACREGPPIAHGSHALLAVGRTPNTADLGLAAAGVAADERGYIEVDDELRTTASGVWALGEANGRGAFTSTAYNDFQLIVGNLFAHAPRKVSERIAAYALFIDPPLGRVGMSEAQALASGRNVRVGKMPMTRVGRARETGETQGFMKVLVDADRLEILGAAILGLHGDEAVQSLLDFMYTGEPYTTLLRTVPIHPTVTELLPTLLGDLKPLA